MEGIWNGDISLKSMSRMNMDEIKTVYGKIITKDYNEFCYLPIIEIETSKENKLYCFIDQLTTVDQSQLLINSYAKLVVKICATSEGPFGDVLNIVSLSPDADSTSK